MWSLPVARSYHLTTVLLIEGDKDAVELRSSHGAKWYFWLASSTSRVLFAPEKQLAWLNDQAPGWCLSTEILRDAPPRPIIHQRYVEVSLLFRLEEERIAYIFKYG